MGKRSTSIHWLFLIYASSLLVTIRAFSQVRRTGEAGDKLLRSFISPPDEAKSRVYWFWIYNRVTREGITRDLRQFKAKGISGVNLICNGGYAGAAPLPGVKFLGAEWRALFRHAIREANRLHIEIGFNLAGGWTFMGPSVTQDDAMKKIVFSKITLEGGRRYSDTLVRPGIVEGYYHDIMIQAFPLPDGDEGIDPARIIDVTLNLRPSGVFTWDVPPGKWVVLRSGYTLTGHPWSKWKAYPEGDTFEGGQGYEIDYLSAAALDRYFDHLGKTVLAEAKKAGGHLDYLWSDSWECGKLTWTQDLRAQFRRFRGYDLTGYLPVLAGFNVVNSQISNRFQDDFNRTIQDCISANCYGHFTELCHRYGLKAGNEAGGPNDIPPQDVLKNFSTGDIVSGEFWVNGHRNAPGGYNKDRMERLNLKQTATAAHVYGKRQAEAEAFTEQEKDATHWTLGPSDLKPYANDAFCEGINRLMLHSATCQPPTDGKPGFEYCAGTHFTPNVTWWEMSNDFFSYLARCQFMLQQGHFVGDVCFYLGERPPLLVPPKYNIPSLGAGYDCDYVNPDVLLNRMTVKNGQIELPDGMRYKLLVLQNCVSPSPEIAKEVSRYQQLDVPVAPANAMSLTVIKRIRELVMNGATVIGPPPQASASAHDYVRNDAEVLRIAAELWGDLNGTTKTERNFGSGRIIWGKTPREVLLADGVGQDFSFDGQADHAEDFDYIHRTTSDAEIYFVINRTDQHQSREFTFRVTGRLPEIWDPVTGKHFSANAFRQKGGNISLPLELDPFGAFFIVFRKPLPKDMNGHAERNFDVLSEIKRLTGPWDVSFDSSWGGPSHVSFPALVSWTQRPEEGIKYYSGRATYRKTFDLGQDVAPQNGKVRHIYLSLGDVKNVATVRLNGKKLGVLWCAPWQMDITDAVLSGGNILEVEVVNLWCNRVVHDLSLPVGQRLTKTHEVFRFDMLNVHTPILASGLLGPVKVLAGKL
ncbi:glycosyl hydrolase [Flavitalea sp. BT771]|uniref:glycosyl hydrolase n=1 Tax=Flavitalea sp. BT771 TaxID=3063329 RepID=UPI0026E3D783|nr:glycosyl hydrolase [Flavitalea sp. BT771]MDO6431973.1 glycosyl hydrolase [Flavitalea sp. BT771]MDV6220882.1 glycosyl hydrolase [Flavitalea sp. BT771]